MVAATSTPRIGLASVSVVVWLLDGLPGRVPKEMRRAELSCAGTMSRAKAQLALLTPTETRIPAKPS